MQFMDFEQTPIFFLIGFYYYFFFKSKPLFSLELSLKLWSSYVKWIKINAGQYGTTVSNVVAVKLSDFQFT